MASELRTSGADLGTGGVEGAGQAAPKGAAMQDNDQEFTARAAGELLTNVGVGTLYIEPGCSHGKGVIESSQLHHNNQTM